MASSVGEQGDVGSATPSVGAMARSNSKPRQATTVSPLEHAVAEDDSGFSRWANRRHRARGDDELFAARGTRPADALSQDGEESAELLLRAASRLRKPSSTSAPPDASRRMRACRADGCLGRDRWGGR